MGTIALVGPDIESGRRFIERFVADGNPVVAAFWIRMAEHKEWSLRVATPVQDGSLHNNAFRLVRQTLEKLDIGIERSDIRPVKPTDPIVLEVLDRLAKPPSNRMVRFQDLKVGYDEIDDILVYPARYFEPSLVNPTMTGEDIGREIVRIMRKSDAPLLPPRITLRDNTHFDGNPIALQLGTGNALVAQFIVSGENLPRVVPLDDIASIV